MSSTSVPTNEQGKIISKGATEWKATKVDDDTVEIVAGSGLRLKSLGVKNANLQPITEPALVSGPAMYNLADIPLGAGQIPGDNLQNAPSDLPTGATGDLFAKGASVWETVKVQPFKIEVHSSKGLQIKDGGISAFNINTAQVTSAKLSGSIPGSKLDLITTALKVHGTALYDLDSLYDVYLPNIPSANLTNAINGGRWKSDEVYSGNATLTDKTLDFSDHIGLDGDALCVLWVYNRGALTHEHRFDSENAGSVTIPLVGSIMGGGCSAVSVPAFSGAYVLVRVVNGILKWRSNFVADTEIHLRGYLGLT